MLGSGFFLKNWGSATGDSLQIEFKIEFTRQQPPEEGETVLDHLAETRIEAMRQAVVIPRCVRVTPEIVIYKGSVLRRRHYTG